MKKDLTVQEFARARGVSLKAVYDQLAVGRVPGAKKQGRLWLIPATALQAKGGAKRP
jgi:excisionase family DNA binding protein